MTYIDTMIDLSSRRWYVNDRVLHTIPGVRSDLGKIAELYHGGVRALIVFDVDGGRAPCYFSELALVSRRTSEDVPYAALEAGAIVYCGYCGSDRHTVESCEKRTRDQSGKDPHATR
jgi:hypothetical protein